MKFGPRPLDQAAGKILAHNLADEHGRRLLRKGHRLSEQDVDRIRALGRASVYLAELEPDDLSEDEAAVRLATAVAGDGVRLTGRSTGRTNLLAAQLGLLTVDAGRLAEVNFVEGVTLASLRDATVVPQGQLVASVKVIPYGLARATVEQFEAEATERGPILQLLPINPRQVALVLQGSTHVRQQLMDDFVPPLRSRIEAWGSHWLPARYVAFELGGEEERLAQALREVIDSGADLILIAGETAIMDSHDLIPQSIRLAGGRVECFGAPVDPGNLLMLAYLDGVPVVGVPGCARSRRENVVDWLIPRLLAGQRLTRADVVQMGHGGLLAEIHERPMPRGAAGDL